MAPLNAFLCRNGARYRLQPVTAGSELLHATRPVLVDQIIAGARCEREDGSRGILTRRRSKAGAVHHEQGAHVVRLLPSVTTPTPPATSALSASRRLNPRSVVMARAEGTVTTKSSTGVWVGKASVDDSHDRDGQLHQEIPKWRSDVLGGVATRRHV